MRYLLLALALATAANLVADVPFYFNSEVPALEALYDSAAYRSYAPMLNLAVPALVGVIGALAILRLERGRTSTAKGRQDRTRLALYVGAVAGASLFTSGLILGLWYISLEIAWNPVRMTLRFVLVLAAGIYLLGTAARLDSGSRLELAKIALFFGTFAAAIRMGIAIINGLLGPNNPISQPEAALSLSAFVIAMLSLFGWIAVYDRVRRGLPGDMIDGSADVPRNGRTGESR